MASLDKKYFQRLIESSPDIIIAVDKSGTVNYYNDGARTSLGYSSEEIIGEGCTRIYPSIDEARRVMKAMRESARQGPNRQLRDRVPQQGRRDHPGHDHRHAHPRRRRQRNRIDRLRPRHPPHAPCATARDRRRNRSQPRARDQQPARIDHQQPRTALAKPGDASHRRRKSRRERTPRLDSQLASNAYRLSSAASTR